MRSGRRRRAPPGDDTPLIHGRAARGIRILAGFVLVVTGLYFETWWGWSIAAAGAYLLLSGVFGAWVPGFLKQGPARRGARR